MLWGMKRYPVLLAFLLLTACATGLDEERLLQEGYTKLSRSAYVMEKPGGAGFSTIASGRWGERTLLRYMTQELRETKQKIASLKNQSAPTSQIREQERRAGSLETYINLLSSSLEN